MAVILGGWAVWLGAIVLHGFRQPKRKAVISQGRAAAPGFGLQAAAAIAPWLLRRPVPAGHEAVAMALVVPSALFGCLAVRALGKQWRLPPALIADHELVRSGPYAIVRHPVYLSFFGMTVAGALAATSCPVAGVCCAAFVAGTEIRVRAEDRLLAARFGGEFEQYRRRVPAYLPGLR